MNATILKNPWLVARAEDIWKSSDIIRRDVSLLAPDQLQWRPRDGGWSIAQILDHLRITDEEYMDAAERALQHAPPAIAEPVWKPSFFGRLLIASQAPDNGKKLQAPKRWVPRAQPDSGVVGRYLDCREHLIELIVQADSKDIARARLRSPAVRWIRLNVGDVFMLLVVHTRRHLRQIEQILQHPGFPR